MDVLSGCKVWGMRPGYEGQYMKRAKDEVHSERGKEGVTYTDGR